jgi:hypothetical protein
VLQDDVVVVCCCRRCRHRCCRCSSCRTIN